MMSSPVHFILACLEKSRSDWEGEDDLVQLQAGAGRLCQWHLCHSKVLERFPHSGNILIEHKPEQVEEEPPCQYRERRLP